MSAKPNPADVTDAKVVSAERIGLTEKALSGIVSVLRKHPRIERATLYGSRATGNFRSGSDIDLTLHGTAISWAEFLDIEREIDDLLLPWKTDLSLYHQIENPDLREHIDRVGLTLWANDANG